MKILKVSFVLLFLVLAVFMLPAGGGRAGSSSAASNSAANVNPPGVYPICKTPITIQVGLPQNPVVENFETNALTKWFEEKGNFKFEYEFFPSNIPEARQKVELTIAAGGVLPEVLIGFTFTEESVLNMGLEGYALPLNDYFDKWAYHMNETMPLLKNKDFKQWCVSADGNIYFVPKTTEQIGNQLRLRSWINKVWLERLGLSTPTTTDEFRNVLQAFVTRDPNGNGVRDEIGLAGGTGWGAQSADWLMNAFIYNDGIHRYIVDNSGKVDVVFNKPEWREGLRYINGLVRDGLMLPQSFTMTDAQHRQLTEGGDLPQVGAMTHGGIGSLFGPTNARKLEYMALGPLRGPRGVQWAAFYPSEAQKNFIITKFAKNPEAIFRWGDLMCTQEVFMRTRYGVPDVDWKVPGPNDKSLLDGIRAVVIPILPWGSVQNSHWAWNHAGIATSEWTDGQVAPPDELYVERWTYQAVPLYVNKEPPRATRVDIQKFTRQEAEELRDLRNNINTYVNECMALFSVGDMNIDRDWDAYLRELDVMGLRRYLELSQTGNDRALGKIR